MPAKKHDPDVLYESYSKKDRDKLNVSFGFGWRVILFSFILLLVAFFAFQSFTIVGAGERGVLLEFGQVQDVIFGEGLHLKKPVANHVVKMDVRTQKYTADATSASKDLQDTQTTVALNYHLDPIGVNKIYQTLGLDYGSKYIDPAIQEVVKASTAQFNAEELITQRPKVKQEIEDGLKDRLNSRGILVETVSITDFKFSREFSKAIEEKVTAQQLALKAENDLKRIEIEAKQKVASAKGDAESIKIIQEQLKFSPDYISYLAVQKWDGVMPLVTGEGAMPLISVPSGKSG